MTCDEMYNEFNLLWNNIMNNSAPGLNKYEISVFLTRAQEQFCISIYNGGYGNSFEETEQMDKYISNIVKQITLEKQEKNTKIDSKSVFYKLPDDLWFITYESAILEDDKLGCANGIVASVVPTTQDRFYKQMRNPFKKPNKNRVLRLSIKDDMSELISEYKIKEYLVRYVKKPEPIILEDLFNISIDGMNKKNECKLNSNCHLMIVKLAVDMAKTSWHSQYIEKQNAQ